MSSTNQMAFAEPPLIGFHLLVDTFSDLACLPATRVVGHSDLCGLLDDASPVQGQV
jgi:hypothetical protein